LVPQALRELFVGIEWRYAPPGCPRRIREVEHRARACAWYRFEADSEWFHNEIDDYGVDALTPDGRRLAVLAATGTD
jgi:hypothetical protein